MSSHHESTFAVRTPKTSQSKGADLADLFVRKFFASCGERERVPRHVDKTKTRRFIVALRFDIVRLQEVADTS